MSVVELPLVSCIIPTYRRSDMLTRAVDSALNQTHRNVEVLVVDDNEPNSAESGAVKELLKKYVADARVRYVVQEKHINGAVARNVGIYAAKGKYIAFLDDDDEWLPEKIEKQVAILENNPEIGGASCLYMHFLNGEETRRCEAYSGDDLQFKILSRQVAVFTSTFMGRKDKIIEAGAFNPTLLRHQDLQFLADFLSVAPIYPVPEHLVKLHADSAINRPNTKKLIGVKNAFFEVEKNLIASYTSKEQKRIRNAHNFEIVFSALKEKKLMTAVQYMLKIGFYLQSYTDVILRYKSRG